MPVSVTSSETDVSSPTKVSTATPLIIQPALSATKQPLNFYYSKVEMRCPENREVTFDNLGLSSNSSIILSNLENTELWLYSVDNPTPVLLKTLPSNTWMTSYSLSPTSENLASIVRNDDGLTSIWTMSLDSGDNTEISAIQVFDAYPYIKWISNEELLLGGNCRGSLCPFPVKVFNTTNDSVVDVERESSVSLDHYEGFFSTNGRYYALYSSNEENQYTQFYAYDYSTGQKISTLSWLDEKIFFYPWPHTRTNFHMLSSDNNMAMIVEQSYGFDIGVIDADVEKMTQNLPYELAMKRVITPVLFDDLDYYIININPLNKSVLINMSYTDYLIDDENLQIVKDRLFSIDFSQPLIDNGKKELIFNDYCFATTGYSNQGHFSPNGQIAVFSSDDEIAFLNLETGYISRLPGWSYVGWVK